MTLLPSRPSEEREQAVGDTERRWPIAEKPNLFSYHVSFNR